MRSAAVAFSLLLALCGSACSSERSLQSAEPEAWTPPAACATGGPGCLDAVVAEMTRRFERLEAACDHDAPFALMYLRVTEAVGRATASRGTFSDRAYLAQLDAVFARYYFDAYDDWRGGLRADVPEAWKVAFEFADLRRVSGVGDLLLGMNAHISRDLPFAVAELGLPPGSRTVQRRSYDQVNGVLVRVSRAILREAATRFDRTIATFTLPVLATNEDNLGLVLSRWRGEALSDAERLLRARTPGQRAAVVRSIERTAATRAAVIVAATSRVSFSKAGRARDTHCRGR